MVAPLSARADTPQVRPEEVLVAVPTLNESAQIAVCLASLIGEDAFMRRTKVVICDGGSQDSTVRIVQNLGQRYENLVCIDNPGRLQSAAINRVVEQEAEPGHRYLVRCDAHAIYPAHYVQEVVQRLAALPEAAAVTTAMDATGTGCLQRAAAWLVDTPLGSGGSAHRGGRRSGWVDHGHHAGFRLDKFRDVGGYDESFSHNEDAELDHRLGRTHGGIWLETGIRMNYKMRDTLQGLWLQYWRYGRGRARTVLKHKMRPRLRQLLPVAAVLALAGSVMIGIFWPPAFLIVAFYTLIAGLAALAGVVALASPCGLWAAPVMGSMHLAWGSGFLFQVLRGEAHR